jgi:hypothetical protein
MTSVLPLAEKEFSTSGDKFLKGVSSFKNLRFKTNDIPPGFLSQRSPFPMPGGCKVA